MFNIIYERNTYRPYKETRYTLVLLFILFVSLVFIRPVETFAHRLDFLLLSIIWTVSYLDCFFESSDFLHGRLLHNWSPGMNHAQYSTIVIYEKALETKLKNNLTDMILSLAHISIWNCSFPI